MASRDIPLLIKSASASSERRITPSWTIAQLKQKLEPVTGIPPSSQKLVLNLSGGRKIPIEADDERNVQLARWDLIPYAEIEVTSLSPSTSTSQFSSLESVPKYVMPVETYSSLPSTVLAFKRDHHIGRFDPAAPELQRRKVKEMWAEVDSAALHPPSRCRISSTRHGTIAYVGPVPELPGPPDAPWIGIILDEPVGKNDGRVGEKRYFECESSRGVFVRPDRVEKGDWGVLGFGEGEGEDEEGYLEEI